MKKFLTMGVLSVMTLVGFSASALADDDRTEAAPTTYYQERVYGQPMHAQPGYAQQGARAHHAVELWRIQEARRAELARLEQIRYQQNRYGGGSHHRHGVRRGSWGQ